MTANAVRNPKACSSTESIIYMHAVIYDNFTLTAAALADTVLGYRLS